MNLINLIVLHIVLPIGTWCSLGLGGELNERHGKSHVIGPFYIAERNPRGRAILIQKGHLYEKGSTFEKKKSLLPGTQQGRTQNFVKKMFFRNKFGSNFQIAISGAIDPINPLNPFLYSFGPFWAKIIKIKKKYSKNLLVFENCLYLRTQSLPGIGMYPVSFSENRTFQKQQPPKSSHSPYLPNQTPQNPSCTAKNS